MPRLSSKWKLAATWTVCLAACAIIHYWIVFGSWRKVRTCVGGHLGRRTDAPAAGEARPAQMGLDRELRDARADLQAERRKSDTLGRRLAVAEAGVQAAARSREARQPAPRAPEPATEPQEDPKHQEEVNQLRQELAQAREQAAELSRALAKERQRVEGLERDLRVARIGKQPIKSLLGREAYGAYRKSLEERGAAIPNRDQLPALFVNYCGAKERREVSESREFGFQIVAYPNQREITDLIKVERIDEGGGRFRVLSDELAIDFFQRYPDGFQEPADTEFSKHLTALLKEKHTDILGDDFIIAYYVRPDVQNYIDAKIDANLDPLRDRDPGLAARVRSANGEFYRTTTGYWILALSSFVLDDGEIVRVEDFERRKLETRH